MQWRTNYEVKQLTGRRMLDNELDNLERNPSRLISSLGEYGPVLFDYRRLMVSQTPPELIKWLLYYFYAGI
jgi:hypothetical protein